MKTTMILPVLLLPVLATACGSAPPTPPAVPIDHSGVGQAELQPQRPTPTPAKTVSPDLAALVATLVDTGEVTSRGVGYAGQKSASYAAYEAVAEAATIDDLRGLISHESPIVRAYVAGHLAREDGDSWSLLTAPLADATPIEAQYGCMGMRTTVAHHVANQLCYVRNYDADRGPDAERLLQSAAGDPSSPAHRDATRCLAQPVPPPVKTSHP